MDKHRECEACGAMLPVRGLGGLCPRCLLGVGAVDVEQTPSGPGGRDCNLLFAVFAVQLRKVTASDAMAVAGAWATDPRRDLAMRLVEGGYLSRADRDFIAGLVAKASATHQTLLDEPGL